jgi:hypothetical protein
MKIFAVLAFLVASSAFANNTYICTQNIARGTEGLSAVYEVKVTELAKWKRSKAGSNYDYSVPTEIVVTQYRGTKVVTSDVITAVAKMADVSYDVYAPNFHFWMYMDELDQSGFEFTSRTTRQKKTVHLTCDLAPRQ